MKYSKTRTKIILTLIIFSFLLSACVKMTSSFEPWKAATPPHYFVYEGTMTPDPDDSLLARAVPQLTLTIAPPQPTPTPDDSILALEARHETIIYTVKEGDYLSAIANKHRVSIEQIKSANPGVDFEILYPEQKLAIPPDSLNPVTPAFQIIPDSELVYGASMKDFDTEDVIQQFNGALHRYKETFWDGRQYTGPQIVQLVANENGVNPRLLLAILEHHGGWLTLEEVSESTKLYPVGYMDCKLDGLYDYLNWAANQLVAGYYGWNRKNVSVWTLHDGTIYRIAPSTNAGTAGVQNLYARFMGSWQWNTAISTDGLYATYLKLFGDPFAFAEDCSLPADLAQPEFIMPIAHGDVWRFTGGPHWGWGHGSPWAALDFAPPGYVDEDGRYINEAPVLAVADGVIVRSEYATVVLDLDGDGNEQTGWTVHYFHIGSPGRIAPGTQVAAGDVIGFASTEGGFTTGPHFHITRRYNGIWIDAYGDIPFNLGGWVAYSTGKVYNGYLEKDGERIEAFDGRSYFNMVRR